MAQRANTVNPSRVLLESLALSLLGEGSPFGRRLGEPGSPGEAAERFIRLFSSEDEERMTFADFYGAGRGIWDGIDAQEYVDSEREAWRTLRLG